MSLFGLYSIGSMGSSSSSYSIVGSRYDDGDTVGRFILDNSIGSTSNPMLEMLGMVSSFSRIESIGSPESSKREELRRSSGSIFEKSGSFNRSSRLL